MNLNIDVKVNSEQSKARLSQVGSALSNLGRNTKATTGEFNKFYSSMKKTNSQYSNITKDANRASASMGKLGKAMGGINQVLGAGKFYLIASFLNKASDSAMDMIEVTNLFSVSMGSLATETDSTLQSMSDLMGLDSTNLRSSVGTFSLLARSMGLSDKNSQTLAVNTSKLALDLASLTNIPIQQVMQDLRSGLVGQSETVYKYGIDVTEAGLKQEAMNQGITKSVRNMSQGEKMALRYATMIRQTGLAQGDFARTLDTPANQMKVMQERVVTLTRAIGTLFIPMIGAVLPYLNAFFKVLTQIIQSLAVLIGYQAPAVTDIKNGFGGIGDEADSATDDIKGMGKAIKDATLGFDELNVLRKDSGSSGSGVSIGGAEFDLKGYDNLASMIKDKSSKIEESIKLVLGKFLELTKAFSTVDFTKLSKAFDLLLIALTPFAVDLFKGLEFLYTKILAPIATYVINDLLPIFIETLASAFDALKIVFDGLKPLTSWLFESFLKPLAEWSGDIIVLAFEKLNEQLKKFTEWAKANPTQAGSLIETFGKIALAVIVFTEIWKFMTIALGIVHKLTPLIGLVFTALGSTMGLVGLAIVAVAGATWLLVDNWEAVRPVLVSSWDKLRVAYLNTFVIPMANNFITLQNSFMNNFIVPTANMMTGWGNSWIAIVNGVGGGFNSMINGMITGINKVITSINSLITAMVKLKIIPSGVKLNTLQTSTYVPISNLKQTNYTPADFISNVSSNSNNDQQGGLVREATSPSGQSSGTSSNSIIAQFEFLIAELAKRPVVVDNVVNLDGDAIYRNQKKVESARGQNFDMGVFVR